MRGSCPRSHLGNTVEKAHDLVWVCTVLRCPPSGRATCPRKVWFLKQTEAAAPGPPLLFQVAGPSPEVYRAHIALGLWGWARSFHPGSSPGSPESRSAQESLGPSVWRWGGAEVSAWYV